ncbi:MAG TPA: DNA recombination protein RmuC [Gaiella sp.]|jgi:DNA recombination protein RmuC
MTIVALLLGLALGAAGVYLVAVRRAVTERDTASAQAAEALRALAEAEGALAAQRATFDERVTNAIKAVSAEALRENADVFATQAIGRLGEYVEPLRKSLEKVETNVGLLEQQRQRAYGEIHKELEIVREAHEGLRTQTGNLVSALRGDSNTRGRWGEIQLERVIELAGMLPYCDFDRQRSLTDEDGRLLRPDVVVRLPGGKAIVIDAKVSLVGYLSAHRSDATDDARRAGLADHARQVRDHIQRLGQKAYWRQLPVTPEFVVMFLHDETSWRAALEVDPTLDELAFSNNVIPASPTNLIGLLRAVHYGWQQETIAESARQISDLGRELYKRLSTMGAHVSKLGRSLDGAVKAYNETVGSLERTVLPQARKFERHGITSIEAPELQPVERQTRALAAPELVSGEEPSLEVLPGDAHAA